MPVMYGAVNLRPGSDSVVQQVRAQVLLVRARRRSLISLSQPRPLMRGSHELGRHHEVGADVLLARQRLLDLGEPLLVVVEVFLVVDGQARWPSGRRRRTRRPCTAASSRCAACRWPGVPSSAVLPTSCSSCRAVGSAGGQERRAEGERRRGRGAAADEAPTRGAVGRESGEESGIDLVGEGMASAFRESGEG